LGNHGIQMAGINSCQKFGRTVSQQPDIIKVCDGQLEAFIGQCEQGNVAVAQGWFQFHAINHLDQRIIDAGFAFQVRIGVSVEAFFQRCGVIVAPVLCACCQQQPGEQDTPQWETSSFCVTHDYCQ